MISETLQKKVFAQIRNRFVDKIVDKSRDQMIALGLLKLCQLASAQVVFHFISPRMIVIYFYLDS